MSHSIDKNSRKRFFNWDSRIRTIISKPRNLLELIEIISIFCCAQSFQCVALIAICKINSIYTVLEVIGAIILISLQPHRLLELIESYLAIVTSNHSNVLP